MNTPDGSEGPQSVGPEQDRDAFFKLKGQIESFYSDYNIAYRELQKQIQAIQRTGASWPEDLSKKQQVLNSAVNELFQLHNEIESKREAFPRMAEVKKEFQKIVQMVQDANAV